MQRCFVVVILTLLGALLVAAAAHAHGVLGKRFTPSSLTVEDPFPSEGLLALLKDTHVTEGDFTFTIAANSQ